MKKIRIAVLHFSHETVTFLPNDTELSDFVFPGSPCRDEELLRYDPMGYVGGFVQCAREYTEVELVGIESPLFPKTGIGSGWVTQEAFEHFAGAMLEDLQGRGPFDGVYMALHGAMAVRGVARPEAELAARVRRVVGSDAILAGTFDPHGNEDEAFLSAADLSFCVKYFPHYDMHLQGQRAARTMVRSIRGAYQPTSVCIKVPIITATVVQWTGASPWMDVVQRALTWEARKPDTYVNVFFGFPWADTVDAGMTVQVTCNGDPGLAREVAQDMASTIWRLRRELLNSTPILPIAQGVSSALEAVEQGRGPVIVADYSDRSGYATWLLAEMQRHGCRNSLFATVTDGPLVERLLAAGVKPGDAFDHEVGGRVEDSAGLPVRVVGIVAGLGEGADGVGSRSHWISVELGDGNVLVLSRFLMQITELAMLEAMGIDAQRFDVIALKSRAHFRRGFYDSGFSSVVVLVEPPQPFLGTTRLDALPYEHLKLSDYFPYGRESFSL